MVLGHHLINMTELHLQKFGAHFDGLENPHKSNVIDAMTAILLYMYVLHTENFYHDFFVRK